jgi:hypothetical protein
MRYDYKINDICLDKVSNFMDLGVIVSDDLTWDEHINNCTSRANKRLGMIKRCIGYKCSEMVKLKCYTSMVRPLVEYNTVVWSCNTKKILSKVESLQRRATKFILNDFNADYKTRLNMCGLLPLCLRRQFLDCVFTYNSLMGLNDFNILDYVSYVDVSMINTRFQVYQDELKFKLIRAKHVIYEKFFTKRIIDVWNTIPYDIRSIELTDLGHNSSFKNALKRWFIAYFNDEFNTTQTCTWIVKCSCQECKLT